MAQIAIDPVDQFQKDVERTLTQVLGKSEGQKVFFGGQKILELPARLSFYSAVLQDLADVKAGQRPFALSSLATYKRDPVSLIQFVCDPYYMNMKDEVYPKVLEELVEINTGKYQEIVCTGGIGSAKTTVAVISQAYQLYLLSCLVNPHTAFGLDSISEILIVFQSINKTIAKASFARFKALIERSQYFKDFFPFDKDILSKLVFPNRIEVQPISGQETGAIGQNVIGGLIDELNYMQVVDKSKQSVDQGQYDQAVALYNSIARRRQTRFSKVGRAMPGLLCLVSSKRYPGQFTDQKEDEAKKDKSIYIYDYRVWDVKPPGSFSNETFTVFIGDETHKPRILEENEQVPLSDRPLLRAIPVDFRKAFEKDIINALREIAGVSTLSNHPFFVDVEKVSAVFGKVNSIFSREWCDFRETKVGVYPNLFVNPSIPRWAHIDLAVTADSAGLAIGHCPGFANMKSLGFGDAEEEMMPWIVFDGVLEIKPPKGGEIMFWKIREVLMKLRTLGLNIQWVSFDTYQSRDSMQLLKQAGFMVGTVSCDVTNDPYDVLKGAVYTGRAKAPKHDRARKEMVSLERDTKTGKIDHPPMGSKDCSDAMAGVAYGLTTRRDIWLMYNVPVFRIPKSVKMVIGKDEDN